MLTEDEMRRLSFIKYLYQLGFDQSRQAQPHASVAILTLHDAVELFLHLATEVHKVIVGKKPLDFADYFGRLEARLPEMKLVGTQSMIRLNQARVGLKHHANLPDETTIQDLVSRVDVFLEDNTPVLFGIALGEVSLTHLIRHADVRTKLASAEEYLASDKLVECMKELALAFKTLVFDYTTRSFSGGSPFKFGQTPHLRNSFMMGIEDRKLSRFVDEVERLGQSVEALQNAVQITSLSLDYRRYAKFRMLTPYTFTASGGIHHVSVADGYNPQYEDCRFCLSFVIDSALKLQQLNFEAVT